MRGVGFVGDVRDVYVVYFAWCVCPATLKPCRIITHL